MATERELVRKVEQVISNVIHTWYDGEQKSGDLMGGASEFNITKLATEIVRELNDDY